MAIADHEKPKVIRRLEAWRETYKDDRGWVFRAAFLTAGVILVLGGIAMLVLPGPAFLVIPIGLAILSLEFAWAAKLLDVSLVQAVSAKNKAVNASRRDKSRGATATALAIAAAAAGAYWWFFVR